MNGTTNEWAYAPHAKLLGKWLRVLFWLIVPDTIAGLLTLDSIIAWFPALELPGTILQSLCTIARCVILLRLATVNRRYGVTGGFRIAMFVLSLLSTFDSVGSGMSSVFSFAESVFGLLAVYNEFTAHSEVLYGLDYELSYNWKTLWKWYIGVLIAMFVAAFAVVISRILALILIVVGAIALLAVSIAELSYLYRTAKKFNSVS